MVEKDKEKLIKESEEQALRELQEDLTKKIKLKKKNVPKGSVEWIDARELFKLMPEPVNVSQIVPVLPSVKDLAEILKKHGFSWMREKK